MLPGLDVNSTYTDAAQHFATEAIGPTVDYVDYLDRDLSEVWSILADL